METGLTDRLAAGRPVVVSRKWQIIGSLDSLAGGGSLDGVVVSRMWQVIQY
jgi:hypothetical protein